MKSLLLLSTFSVCLTAPLWAQSDDSSTTTTTPKHHWHGGAGLTKEEWQELKAAHESALQANPDLATEDKQLHEQNKAHFQKMHDAMVKADPNVEPILAKLKGGHHHHHPGASTTDSSDSDNT
jgi:hypothetical protein